MLLGVITGATSGYAVAKRQLKFLTKNGETRVPLSTVLFLFGGMFILLSFWVYYAFTAPIKILTLMLDFAYTTLPAYLAVEDILFLRWERKQRKLILAGTWSNRLYVSPMSG